MDYAKHGELYDIIDNTGKFPEEQLTSFIKTLLNSMVIIKGATNDDHFAIDRLERVAGALIKRVPENELLPIINFLPLIEVNNFNLRVTCKYIGLLYLYSCLDRDHLF